MLSDKIIYNNEASTVIWDLMKHSVYNNKRIIWKSRSSQIWLVLVSFFFVAAALLTRDRSSSFIFWAGIVFFGSGGLFILIRLLNPKNLFVTYDSSPGKEIFAEQLRKKQESLGFFDYTDTGFNLIGHKGRTHYNWEDIETVFGFKEDRFTTDEICMDIFLYNKSSLRLTESTSGWYQFNSRLSKNIPAIPPDWDSEVAFPAFETKLTLLFDKKGRTLKDAEAACYSEIMSND